MNWEKEIKKLTALLPGEVRVSASEKENERALNQYNRALEHIEEGNLDMAMIALDRLTSEFPLFAKAAHLYGLCLGWQRNWQPAEKMLQQALLSELSDEEYHAVEKAKYAAREGKIRAKEINKSKRQKEDLLLAVKADLAKGGILEKADHSKRADKMRMATAREREEVLKQIRDQEQGRLPRGIQVDTGEDRGRWLQIISLIAISAAVIFLIFYFLIRPGIIDRRLQKEKLSWIETELEKRAAAEELVADLLKDYQSKYPAD